MTPSRRGPTRYHARTHADATEVRPLTMKALAITAIVAGAVASAYGLAGWLASQGDPLADLLLLGIAVPALPPLVLGVLLLRGHRWVLHGLRAMHVLLLVGGAWLTWGVGLGVFSFAPFAVPFVAACLLWLAMSFVPDRGRDRGLRRDPAIR